MHPLRSETTVPQHSAAGPAVTQQMPPLHGVSANSAIKQQLPLHGVAGLSDHQRMPPPGVVPPQGAGGL